MTWLTVAALATLILAAYLSSLTLALHRKRRASLLRRCEEIDRAEAGRWIVDHRESTLLALSLLRTAARISVFIFVLLEMTRFGEGMTLQWQTVVTAGVVSVVVIWLMTTVLSIPISTHAGVGLIVRSLPVLRVAAVFGAPLARSLRFVDEAVRRLSGANLTESDEAQEELLRSIEESHIEGGLEPEAAAMLENVVSFRRAEVSEIMTPRTDIEGIEYTDDLADIRLFIRKAGHSRIPVYRENLDQIVGILYVKDLVPFLGTDADEFQLQPVLRKPIVVPEIKSVPELLSDFQQAEVHMAIVIDEYGGTAGLVTIEDVLEEIVGEIHDEHEPEDEEEPTLTTIDETHAEVDGRFHIDDLNEQLRLDLPEDEDYETVAGFMLARMGRVPAVGESFEAHNARFTTIEATETHIQKVGIELLATMSPNGSNGDRDHAVK